jgi:hypothetical protein
MQELANCFELGCAIYMIELQVFRAAASRAFTAERREGILLSLGSDLAI